MDSGMGKCFVGPMPVNEFLEKFLPVLPPPTPKNKPPGFEAMTESGMEGQTYNEFAKVANRICSNLRAVNTSENPADEEDSYYQPDVTFYDGKAALPNNFMSFQKMEMFVEFKHGGGSDSFNTGDEDPQFERLPESACETRGQIVVYSTAQQTWQFRTWTFSIGIFGNIARLFRWDRAGAIVSEPIPYRKEGNRDLVEFLRRFDVMDRAQRGWDPTVFNATPEEATAFGKAIRDAMEEERIVSLKSLLVTVGEEDRYLRKRIDIPEGDGEGERVVSYIVGRLIEKARSPMGRATRGFVAMSMDTKKLVFLKDSWRPDLPGMKGEAQWFKKLKGARNIFAFLHGSDVRCVAVRRCGRAEPPGPDLDLIQRTLTDVHSEKFLGEKEMMGYIHYRTVQSEFYIPLNMFTDSKHLTRIILDITHAVKDLYDRGVIHRDISTGNIMIGVGGEGHLIDFDLARDRDETGARMSVRTGTWQFMSTRLLSKPGKAHELCDDLESLWFVLLYEGLHSVKHNEPSGIDTTILFYQRRVYPTTGVHTGGVGKSYLYTSQGYLLNENLEFESKPFTVLVRQLYRLFKSLDAYCVAKEDNEPINAFHEENVGKLKSCAEIERLLTEALDSKDWPEVCDKVDDQYLPTKNSTFKRKNAVGSGFLNPRSTLTEPPKRKREEEGDIRISPTKRSRTDVPSLQRI